MHIEFIRNHGAYSPGDIAGFDPAVAEVLVKEKGVAVVKTWGEGPAPAIDAGSGDVTEITDTAADAVADQPVRGRRKK